MPVRAPGAAPAPAGPFAIVVLNADSVAIEVVNGTWPSIRLAHGYALTLRGIAGWRVVPARPAKPET